MMLAVRIHRQGGPEELRVENVELGEPGQGEVQIRHTAIGLNYLDTYHRSGLYRLDNLPLIIGMEAAGIVEKVGADVVDFAQGQRVVYCTVGPGAYAESRNVPTTKLVAIPDDISDEIAAAILLKGLTTCYLLTRTYPVKKGETILIHAAAGGVGLIACQWAKHIGARVIGTVGSEEKASLAKQNGCDEVILYRDESVSKRVRELTDGDGVPVVYDSVGADTFIESLDSLRNYGLIVSFGNASGSVTPFDLSILAAKGSLFLTRPTLMNYASKPDDLRSMADQLFALVRSGVIKIHINHRYELKQVEQAHRDLESRKTTGSVIIQPSAAK